jgi:HPt (histidine-containing phosphotransfer) domain-containing protein
MEADALAPVNIEGFRATMREAGIEEIVDMTLNIYVEEAGRLFGELSAAFESQDMEVLRAHAHTLKSSSANIWAQNLAALFATMEAAASDRDTDTVASIFGQLRPEFDSVMAHLAEAGATG